MWVIRWVGKNDSGNVYVFSERQIKKWISENSWRVQSYTVEKVN